MSGTAELRYATAPERALWRALRRPARASAWRSPLLFLVLTVAAPWIAPYDPYDQDLSSALHRRPPSICSAPTSTAATCSAG